MKNLEDAIFSLKIQLENQSKEIKSLNSNLKNNANKSSKHHREVPRYQTNFSKYHRNNDGQCYSQEYSFKETIFFPEIRHDLNQENYYENEYGNYCNARTTFPRNHASGYIYPKKYQNGTFSEVNYSKSNLYEKSKPAENLKKWPITEADLIIRHNHSPFIIDKAKCDKRCIACRKMILKDSTIIIHKEIKAHFQHGWEKPLYNKTPNQHFYHFDKKCLDLRGFENTYLSLCYIEATYTIEDIEKTKIKELGFRRPIVYKTPNIQNETNVENHNCQGIKNDVKIEITKTGECENRKDKIEENNDKIEHDIENTKSQKDDFLIDANDVYNGTSDDDFLGCEQMPQIKDDFEVLEFDFCD